MARSQSISLLRTAFALSLLLYVGAAPDAAAAGSGYRVEVGDGDDAIPLVVVSGTAYEMGFALGDLLGPEIRALMPAFLEGAQASEPEKYSDAALDAAWEAIAPHTGAWFLDEIRGVADATGLPPDELRRAHMIPVVSEFACSGAALWGEATRDGSLLQFRNLDYTMDAGLQDFPALVMYLPADGVAHLNVTFAGYICVNTGINAEGVVLTEMGDSPSREYPYDLNGAHFSTLFRELLYDARTLDDAVRKVQQAQRIKKYHYIISSGKEKRGVKMKAHAPDLVIWTDNDPTDEVAPDILPNVVYNCESRDPIGFAHLKAYHRRYDADAVIQLSKAVGSLRGNLLNAVYDATNLEVWVAYAHGTECAYRRPYVHVPLRDHLDASRPPEGAVAFTGDAAAPR